MAKFKLLLYYRELERQANRQLILVRILVMIMVMMMANLKLLLHHRKP